MSEENVDIVRGVYEAAAQRDTEAVLSLYDPDVEWDTSHHPMAEISSGFGIRRGHEGLRSWFRDWYEAFEDFEHELQELIDTGEHVVSVGIDRGRGRGSGLVIHRQIAGVWTIRDGKVKRVVWFVSRDEALAAARAEETARRVTDYVEIVRGIYADLAKGNFEVGRDIYDDDMVLVPRKDVPDANRRYLGPEGLREFMRGWLGAWEDLTMTAEDLLEVGDSIVVTARMRATGKESGVPAESTFFQVWSFRGGRVIRIQQFGQRSEALAALGLSE
jgi:ketosteroid isomerase-like protein